MVTRPHPLFNSADLDMIAEATRRAEQRTAGEIVPYSVDRCHRYEVASWRAATIGALVVGVVVALVHIGIGAWGISATWLVLAPLAGAATGMGLAQIPALRRWLVGAHALDRMVRLRAEGAFLEEELFSTRDRTGILIFLALFERRVVVLGDAGINAQVKPEEWQVISARLARGIGDRVPAAALVAAIEACGDLLARRHVERRADDTDELTNELRIRQD